MASSVRKAVVSRLKLNLLYPQNEGQKLPLKFLKWLISYGRFIVVIVEVVVLGTFATRFKYDADLASLKEEINSRIPYLEVLSNDEAVIRQTHQRLELIKKTYASSSKWDGILRKISSQTPANVKINNINIVMANPAGVFNFKVTAETNSNSNLAVFLHGLRSEPSFKDVALVSISLDKGTINFTIIGLAQ